MTAATILRDLAAAGVTLSLSSAGTIKAAGEKAAVALWLATIKENKVDILALLSEAASRKPCRAASRWLLHFSDRKPLTVDFSPAATLAKVLASYPSALAAEPIEAGRRQPATMLTGKQETAVVAKPGCIVSANNGYRPVPGVLQRGLAFVPAHQPANSPQTGT